MESVRFRRFIQDSFLFLSMCIVSFCDIYAPMIFPVSQKTALMLGFISAVATIGLIGAFWGAISDKWIKYKAGTLSKKRFVSSVIVFMSVVCLYGAIHDCNWLAASRLLENTGDVKVAVSSFLDLLSH